MQRININDVAKEAGVHRSTVSRALTGSGPVSQANRERVMEAVKKLKYHPNTLAGSLKSRRRNTWGLLSFWYSTPNSMDYYYAKSLGGLMDTANKHGQRLLLCNMVGRFDEGDQAEQFCHDSHLGGVVVLAPRTEEKALALLKGLGIPAVLLAYRAQDPELSGVDIDNARGVRMVMDHLRAKGHQRIGYIGGELALSANARDRYQGYVEGLKAAGLPLDQTLVKHGTFEPVHGQAAARALLDLPAARRPTALFCATDMLAIAAMAEAKAKGLRIPSDLAVAGFDNNPEAERADPALTTVHFPFYEAGQKAGEVLLRLMKEPAAAPLKEVLDPQLIVRKST